MRIVEHELDTNFTYFVVFFGKQGKEAGIRTLVALDDQGGRF